MGVKHSLETNRSKYESTCLDNGMDDLHIQLVDVTKHSVCKDSWKREDIHWGMYAKGFYLLLYSVALRTLFYYIALKLPFRSQLINFLKNYFQKLAKIYYLCFLWRNLCWVNWKKNPTQHWVSYFHFASKYNVLHIS